MSPCGPYKPTLTLDGNDLATLKVANPTVGQKIELCCDATITGINSCGDPDDPGCINITFELSNIVQDSEEDSMDTKAEKLYSKPS